MRIIEAFFSRSILRVGSIFLILVSSSILPFAIGTLRSILTNAFLLYKKLKESENFFLKLSLKKFLHYFF